MVSACPQTLDNRLYGLMLIKLMMRLHTGLNIEMFHQDTAGTGTRANNMQSTSCKTLIALIVISSNTAYWCGYDIKLRHNRFYSKRCCNKERNNSKASDSKSHAKRFCSIRQRLFVRRYMIEFFNGLSHQIAVVIE